MCRPSNWCTTVGFVLVTVTLTSALQPANKAAVYAALFNSDHWNLPPLSKLVVKSTAISMPSLAGANSEWLTQWDAVPDSLRRVAEQSQPTDQVALSSALFPSGTRLVAGSAVEGFFTSGTKAEDKWPGFNRQFEAAGWVGFSDIVFTADQSDALVYYEGRCGGLCGVGAYAWLHRGPSGSDWVIRKAIVRWVS